jgi:hypothetical protein
MERERCCPPLVYKWLSHGHYCGLVIYSILYDISLHTKIGSSHAGAPACDGMRVVRPGGVFIYIGMRRCNIARIFNDHAGYDRGNCWATRNIFAHGIHGIYHTGDYKSILCNARGVSIIFCGDIRNNVALAKCQSAHAEQPHIKIHIRRVFDDFGRNPIHHAICIVALWRISNLWNYREHDIFATVFIYPYAVCNNRNNLCGVWMARSIKFGTQYI